MLEKSASLALSVHWLMVVLSKTFFLSLKVSENMCYSWKASICQVIRTDSRVSFPPLNSDWLSPWLNLLPWLDVVKNS